MKRVFVNGTFDILHSGHIFLLNEAKKMGDYLLVALDSDSRYNKLKGLPPVFEFSFRRDQLLALRAVDEVVQFETDEHLLALISTCDIMVKGSDYRNMPIIGQEIIDVVFVECLTNGQEKISSSHWR